MPVIHENEAWWGDARQLLGVATVARQKLHHRMKRLGMVPDGEGSKRAIGMRSGTIGSGGVAGEMREAMLIAELEKIWSVDVVDIHAFFRLLFPPIMSIVAANTVNPAGLAAGAAGAAPGAITPVVTPPVPQPTAAAAPSTSVLAGSLNEFEAQQRLQQQQQQRATPTGAQSVAMATMAASSPNVVATNLQPLSLAHLHFLLEWCVSYNRPHPSPIFFIASLILILFRQLPPPQPKFFNAANNKNRGNFPKEEGEDNGTVLLAGGGGGGGENNANNATDAGANGAIARTSSGGVGGGAAAAAAAVSGAVPATPVAGAGNGNNNNANANNNAAMDDQVAQLQVRE